MALRQAWAPGKGLPSRVPHETFKGCARLRVTAVTGTEASSSRQLLPRACIYRPARLALLSQGPRQELRPQAAGCLTRTSHWMWQHTPPRKRASLRDSCSPGAGPACGPEPFHKCELTWGLTEAAGSAGPRVDRGLPLAWPARAALGKHGGSGLPWDAAPTHACLQRCSLASIPTSFSYSLIEASQQPCDIGFVGPRRSSKSRRTEALRGFKHLS